MTKVVFPCDQQTWWQVKDRLHKLKQLCEQGDVDLATVAVEHQAIINISTGIGEYGSTEYKHTAFYNLAQFFIKKAMPSERTHFLQETLPGIIELALEVQSLLPTEGIAVSEQQNGETRLFERQLCCSILACAFLCLIPDIHGPKLCRSINFYKFFSLLYLSSQMAKLRCILNFFDRVSATYHELEGNVSFTRMVVRRDELPTLDTWLNSATTLCPLTVIHDGCIEDSCPEAIEVDFANRYIGGGTMGKGRVQEEIRFTVCPELIVSMLFMECMEENEAIIIKGYEQFSQTGGYAGGLMFVGDYRDPKTCQRDVDGFLKNTLCAIDAISYSHREGLSIARQYQDNFVLRDLNKAFVGFLTPFIIPEETKSSQANEDDYFTADEEETNNIDQTVDIDMFVDDLLHQAIGLALPEAIISSQQEDPCITTTTTTAQQDIDDNCEQHPPSTDEVHMNHLEVRDFRDWYAQYRRRSSNLSDLSSRRSSWDVASRRSSGCSMRGYSSEFSSEFEEYYDNFQIQDQKYKYHTIKEEVGTLFINDFATALATNLLKQCTLEVSQMDSGLQNFDDSRPADVENPRPYRLNPIQELSVTAEFVDDQTYSIRTFVDRLFEVVWPFGPVSESNQDTREAMLSSIVSKCNDDEGCRNDKQMEEQENEERLYSVADKLVTKAIDEAFLEYRYRYLCPTIRTFEAQTSTESSQSDHSSKNKDQSYSMNQAQTLPSDSQSDMTSVPSSAFTVAERVVLSIFDNEKKRGTSDILDRNETCDISSIEASQSIIHSSSSQNNDSPETSDLYDKIADRLLSRGFSSAHNQNSFSKSNENSDSKSSTPFVELPDRIEASKDQSVSSSGSLSTHSSDKWASPVCCVTDYYQFCDMLGNHPSYVHSALTCDQRSSQQDSRDPYSLNTSSTIEASRNSGNTSGHTSGNGIGHSISLPSRASSRKSKHTGDRRRSSSKNSDDKSAINSSESSNAHLSDIERLGSMSNSSLGEDQTDQKSGKHDLSPEGARPKTRKHLQDTLHPGSHRHSHHNNHHHHHHIVGGKKNYDQFANCLSRDLLTNAFLQVQEHREPFVYPRRSSEPLQISDGAALQRLENSIQRFNGKRCQKSMTVEDIGPFEVAWSNELECYPRNASGFRDPVLKRFAEELMKVNVSVPTLQLLSDCFSTSGSSRSVCSTISSFRDPLLASFEDELLNTSFTRGLGSFKTQISWSKMKNGSMCSPRQNENKNNKTETKPRINSFSIESEVSAISWKSMKSNSIVVCSEEVSEFAELLARKIVCEALTATVCRTSGRQGAPGFSIDMFSDMLAADIISAAVLTAESKCSDWLEQSKMVTWSDEMDCQESKTKTRQSSTEEVTDNGRESSMETGSSCVEYEDAFNFPFTRLEDFADDLAATVLRNSVAISKREQNATLRKQYGRPISTGNWGCGAFGGDPHLKSLIQWLAASYAGTPAMIYYTFNNPQLEKFPEVIETIQTRGWDVSQLMQAIRRYCITAESEMRLTGSVSKDLFTVILQGEVFPGV